MFRWFWLGCLVGAFAILSGCDSGQPKPVKINGTVLLDDKPLEDGSIAFYGEGGVAAESFLVKNGKFEGEAKPGKKKVQIQGFKETKTTTMDKEEIVSKPNFLPAKWNSESKLTAEVTGSGLTPSEFKVFEK
jgi:hypothetical protein